MIHVFVYRLPLTKAVHAANLQLRIGLQQLLAFMQQLAEVISVVLDLP